MGDEGFPMPEGGPESLITDESKTGVRIEIFSSPSEMKDGDKYWQVEFHSPKIEKEKYNYEEGALNFGPISLGSEKKGFDHEKATWAMYYMKELASRLDGKDLYAAAGIVVDYSRGMNEPSY